MEKKLVFEDSKQGFIHWCGCINKIRIRAAAANAVSKNKAADVPKYWKNEQLTYLKTMKALESLNDSELAFVRVIINKKTPSASLYRLVSVDAMYQKWRKIMFSDRHNRLVPLTKNEIGNAIRNARKEMCMTRKEVAELIGIPANTLKAYEEGKRMLPFNIFYLLYQFLYIRLKYLP